MPKIFGHRGYSGLYPEQTRAAHIAAFKLGADGIELDIVPTKDGDLAVRHEPIIHNTTNVAEILEFQDRKTTHLMNALWVDGQLLKTIDGGEFKDSFSTLDFTMAELRTLLACQPFAFRKVPEGMDERLGIDPIRDFRVQNLEDVLIWLTEVRKIKPDFGLSIEIKHAAFFDKENIEQKIYDLLIKYHMNSKDNSIYIYSFEPCALRKLKKLGLKNQMIQLITIQGSTFEYLRDHKGPKSYADMLSKDYLKEIKAYANGVGPNKRLLVPKPGHPDTETIDFIKKLALQIHIWTFRAEKWQQGAGAHEYEKVSWLGSDYKNFEREVLDFVRFANVLLTDQPDLVAEILTQNKIR